MRLNGVRFDRDKAVEVRNTFNAESSALVQWLAKEHGVSLNARSSKALATYCDKNNIKYPLTEKGNPSFNGDFLDGHSSPVLSAVSKIRKLDKMVNDFINPWMMHSEHTGRIHPRWLTTASEEGGTRSGRLASKDPNMQQVPVRDPYFGPIMRALFLPNEGQRWAKLDVNSQEIRIAVHYAYKLKCRGADIIVQAYRDNPRLDFHQMVADMADVERDPAKTISLGTLYGMSQRRMSARLGFSAAHSEEVYQRYFEAAPYFKELANIAMEVAEKRGFVETYLGRRRRFEGHQNLHKSLNAIVQGTAADMIKVAMWNIWERYQEVALLTVHDELWYSVDEGADHLTHEIENAIKFEVPMIADPILGESWNL